MRYVLFFLLLLNTVFALSQVLVEQIINLDKDGIPDDWEQKNGLDPTNPLDAFSDWDCDNILNIHEYYLRSSPLDINSPIVIEISESNLGKTLNDHYKNFESDLSVVFRLASGKYTVSESIIVHKKRTNACIQGGWDKDFKKYSPNTHKTVITQGDEFSRNFIFSIGNGKHGSFIMDGVVLTNFRRFISIGNNNNSKSDISFYNCEFINFDDEWGSNMSIIKYAASGKSSSQIDFINCTFANNYANGISFKLQDDAQINCRIINSTISNMISSPNNWISSGNAFVIIGGPSSKLKFDLVNSIFWNIENRNFYLDYPKDVIVEIDVKNSLLDFALNDENIIYGNIENNILEDPLFIAPLANNFNLQEESACVNSGTILGLPYNQNLPDMGAHEFGEIEFEEKENTDLRLSVYPNPCTEWIKIKFSIDGIYNIKLDVYNESGAFVQNIYNASLNKGDYELNRIITDWDNGVFIIRLSYGQEFESIKLVKF